MTKTYAAFYLPPEEKEIKQPDQKNVDRIKKSISSALRNAKQSVLNFDVNDIARNMDLQSNTEFVQRYAVGALSKIINNEPVTNKTMLDSLFNTYAPALNAGLAQTGFNSLVELKNAVETGNGNINVANFVQGFSDGLSIVQNNAVENDYRSKYGEEIPIDVVIDLNYNYSLKTPSQEVPEVNELFEKYVPNLAPIKLTLKASVVNENAELWNINDFSAKIVDIMTNKVYVIVRIGKSIYENCIISTYNPTITSIYKIDFSSEIILEHNTLSPAYKEGQNQIMNLKPPVCDYVKFDYNVACKEVYKGIMS